MNSRLSSTLPQAYVLDVEALKKIHSRLEDRIGPVSISAECADEVTRNFDGLSQLTAYENSRGKRILNLELAAKSTDFEKRASVEFSDKWYFGGVRLVVDARNDVVERIRTDLLEIVQGLRPWYAPIASANLMLCCAVAFSTGIAALAATPIAIQYFGSRFGVNPGWIAIALGGGITLAGIKIYSLTHHTTKTVFPMGSILIGQHKERHKTMETFRWILVSTLAPMIVGAVYSLFRQFSSSAV